MSSAKTHSPIPIAGRTLADSSRALAPKRPGWTLVHFRDRFGFTGWLPNNSLTLGSWAAFAIQIGGAPLGRLAIWHLAFHPSLWRSKDRSIQEMKWTMFPF